MRLRTYFIETWGCQMNRHDSELIAGQLRAHGLAPAETAQRADLVVLNTCSVRERPVHKIVSRIGALACLPEPPVIGICGCVAEQEGASLLKRSGAVGFVVGPGEVRRLGEALSALGRGERPVLTGFDTTRKPDLDEVVRSSATRGMVTVVEGCNEFCTFCVVPYTRGRERSRALAEVLDEVRGLAAAGLREVELLGQTINSYRCPTSGADFAELLRAAAAIPGLARVRYITSHPRHFDERLIATLAACPQVSRYLHLPVQTGSDRVLARMHRRYTRAEYLELVARLRRSVPGISLSTDVIVGFPGEEEADFEHSLELLEEVRFGQVFAFAFSPRPRTPAARYPGQVPEGIKKERLHRLFELSDRISLELNRDLVGSTIAVLIDGDSRRDRGWWQGRGEDNRVLNFPKIGHEAIGDIVGVRVVAAGAHGLIGVRPGSSLLPVLERGIGAA
jgi:tRNA-2-methylthio-N6-dimethylallyladenosine synthase